MSNAADATVALLELMARLRDPARGCPWDREQTFATIAPFTIEEAYEVADAIDRGEPGLIRDELGDLLFQIVFHARMAEERGWFDFAAVAGSVHSKLVRRHPHVFDNLTIADPQAQTAMWEDLKAAERADQSRSGQSQDTSALANTPRALPALARAAKLGRRAARVGFDWEEPAQVRDKVLEELREVDEAVSTEHRREELGDLLFAVANWSIHLKIDPEEALRAANSKFERRFRHMERLAAAAGTPLGSLSVAQWEVLWRQAKQA